MLDNINNIKLKHFHRLSEVDQKEYIKILSFLKPIPTLGRRSAKDVFEMTFAEVENMRRGVSSPEGMIKAMSTFFDCPEKYLVDYRIVQFYHAFNHLMSQLQHITNIERINLSKPPKQDMIDAGVKELDRFGALNTLDLLAKEYGKSPEEIEQWSYSLIYSLMWKRKIESDIQDNWQEANKSKKA